MLGLLFWLCFGGGPILSNPQPKEPADAIVHGNITVVDTKEFTLSVEPLSGTELRGWFRDQGVSERLLAHEQLDKLLSSFASFRLIITNKGDQLLSFNPEQIMLRQRAGLVGFQVKRVDLLHTPYGHSDPELEKLAALFFKDTSQVAPGQSLKHLVAFRPFSGRFPKRVTYIQKIFYGITRIPIECQFQVRYKKS